MKIKVFLIISILFFVSCVTVEQHNPYKLKRKLNLHQKKDKQRLETIDNCKNDWIYIALEDTLKIKVIQYLPAYQHSLNNLPAMIIGNYKNDTIRILAFDHFDKLKKGQIISVFPDSVRNEKLKQNDNIEIGLLKRDTQTHLSKRKSEDSFYCEVKETLFGVIKN